MIKVNYVHLSARVPTMQIFQLEGVFLNAQQYLLYTDIHLNVFVIVNVALVSMLIIKQDYVKLVVLTEHMLIAQQ